MKALPYFQGTGSRKTSVARVRLVPGEGTVIVNGKETMLKANDSCVIEPNEMREIINRGNEVCTIVVAVAMPPK